MALTHNGTVVQIPTSRVPSDYTLPTVSTFTDHEYVSSERTLTVLKATVEDSDRATTLQNIIDNASIGLDKQIEDLISAEFDVTNTVESYAVWTGIDSNQAASGSNDFLTDTAMSYSCTVKFYVKSA
jgi:hypothetical protein